MAMPSQDLIQDITTRFILTAPAEQLMYFESIMFLVEQAHWYYEDFVREQDSSLRSLSLRDFARVVFKNCSELRQHLDDIEQIMEHFKAFKKNVPVMGGILLDRSLGRVLLVKGWKNTACWGFPRGKIHKNETDVQCAVREVMEETGYDIEHLVSEVDFIELTLDGKRNKLYIVPGLDPDSAQFAPQCRGEIGGYAWHRVADLPASRDEGAQTFVSEDGAKHRFFMVWPYMKPLRKWIRKRQQGNPDWDMPASAMSTAAQQAQQQYLQQGAFTPAVAAAQQQQQQQQQQHAGTMHAPYYPQHVQQVMQQAAANAPPPRTKQQAELMLLAALQQGRRQQAQGSTQVCAMPAGSPLAALFAGGGAGEGSAGGSGSGAGGAGATAGGQFRFDVAAILRALA